MKTSTIPCFSLKLVREKSVKYRPVINTPDMAEGIFAFMRDLPEEHFYVLMLDARNQPIGLNLVSKGTLTASLVHPREVFKTAILANAVGIIVAHNHPSGNPKPSSEDIETTEVLIKAGRLLSIPVIDHLVIGDLQSGNRSIRESHSHLWGC